MPKPKRQVETCDRLKCTQQISEVVEIQNGNPRVYTDVFTKGPLGDVHRFHRHVPAYSDAQSVSQISAFLHRQTDLPVHLTSVRAVDCPSSVHHDGKGGKIDGSQERYPPIPIFGRLDDSFPARETCENQTQDLLGLVSQLGWIVNQEELRARTHAGIRLPGLSLQSGRSHRLSNRRSTAEIEGVASSSLISKASTRTNVYVRNRSHGLNRKVSAPGEDADATFSVAPKTALAYSRASDKTDTSRRGYQEPHTLVARPRQSNETSAPSIQRTIR